MNAKQFSEFWIKNIKSIGTLDEIKKQWKGDWTGAVLSRTRLDENLKGYFFDLEKQKIDLVIYSKEKFIKIPYFDNSGTFDSDNLHRGFRVIVEHENNYQTVFEEIAKLVNFKSPLKVLITYPHEKIIVNTENALIKKMKIGISQGHSFFPENNDTKYLLITGLLNNKDKELIWNYYLFDFKGKNIEKWSNKIY